MAGSWGHIDQNRKFTMDLIENMGDAYEALEECHWLILHLAKGDRKKIKRAVEEYYRIQRGEK